MRWFFKVIAETVDEFVYAYSRENREFDGRIRINKKSGSATIEYPSAEDANSDFAQTVVCAKAYRLKMNNFPDALSVCCG